MECSRSHRCPAWKDQQQGLPEHSGDQVHPMVQASLFDGDGIFEDGNAPIHTTHMGKNWYHEHEGELEHMEWPPQSLNLNIIEHLWCVLERQVRNRYPPQSCPKELEQVLMEEWLIIPLEGSCMFPFLDELKLVNIYIFNLTSVPIILSNPALYIFTN